MEFDKIIWRKIIGSVYKIRVDKFIYDDKLYTLNGKEIKFNTLSKSKIWVSEKYLGKCDIKK